MTTIDDLFDKMDRLKCSYSRTSLLSYLFEFSYQLMDRCQLPKTQYTIQTFIEYKLTGIVQCATKNYKHNSGIIHLDIPSTNRIPSLVEHELNSWKKYFEGKNDQKQTRKHSE